MFGLLVILLLGNSLQASATEKVPCLKKISLPCKDGVLCHDDEYPCYNLNYHHPERRLQYHHRYHDHDEFSSSKPCHHHEESSEEISEEISEESSFENSQEISSEHSQERPCKSKNRHYQK